LGREVTNVIAAPTRKKKGIVEATPSIREDPVKPGEIANKAPANTSTTFMPGGGEERVTEGPQS